MNSQQTKVVQDTHKQWQYTLTRHQGGNKLIFIQSVSEGTTSILVLKSGTTSMVIPFPLWPAEDYDIHFLEDTRESDHTSTCVPTGKFSFRTKMAQKDVFELYHKCLDYLYSKFPHFLHLPHLYRNKSPWYYDNILKNKGGWMNGYVKNDGGDPASALNGRIHGLFFSAVLNENTGQPPPLSPFGSTRLFIPTLSIFNDRMNLYFADFYCHFEQKRHKVQLVLTPKGTEDDAFCQQRLLCLDPYQNPFFYRQHTQAKRTTTYKLSPNHVTGQQTIWCEVRVRTANDGSFTK
ncbi:uncharacterized protein [Argopecten irradians]|uniref:uncharacterized protein n=1 Tax=Argopecten irradians TaxID=31199 RepID=UPI00371BF858